MPAPRDVHRASTQGLSLAMFVIGVVMVISTLARGGGPLAIGLIMGILFTLAGGGRLYVARKGG